ncbi:MAG: DUF6883 domain-containing protein [Gammaproteobacteria bacterium]
MTGREISNKKVWRHGYTFSEDKITGYLLSPIHRDGRHKAAFFLGLGFAAEAWQALAAALLKHAADHEVAKVESMPFGTR